MNIATNDLNQWPSKHKSLEIDEKNQEQNKSDELFISKFPPYVQNEYLSILRTSVPNITLNQLENSFVERPTKIKGSTLHRS